MVNRFEKIAGLSNRILFSRKLGAISGTVAEVPGYGPTGCFRTCDSTYRLFVNDIQAKLPSSDFSLPARAAS